MDYVITAGDMSSGLSIGSDDSLYIDDGGTAVDTTADGAPPIENYGMTTGTTLYGSEELTYGEADATVVYGGGDISTYGVISATVASGGHVTIYSGGDAYDTVLTGSGAREVVLAEDGTVSITTTIGNGGTVLAVDGAAIFGTLVVMSGGSATVNGAGTTTNDDVDGGIEQTAGGTVSATVENGGKLFEQGSGVASGAVVSSGGTLYIEAAVGSDTDVGPGGLLEDGGTTSGTLLSGATEEAPYTAIEIVERGGYASGTLIYGGGYQEIANGGTAFGTQVEKYGVLVVSSGGSAVSATMNAGAYDPGNGFISVSGVTTGTTLMGHAIEFVDEGGVASNTIVSSGAEELVSGGTISGSIFYYAGRAMVGGVTGGNGSAVSATLSAGGVLAVQPGGFTSYTTISFAGSESVNAAGSTDSSTVDSGGVEFLDAGSSVTDLVMEQGGAIDLSQLTYTSGGSAVVTAPGVLTVTEGKTISAVDLSASAPGGQTTAVYSVGHDAGAGTLVTLASVATVPCFARGTAILTEHGARAVEALRIGERIVTAAGAMRPVVWTGTRRLDCRTHARPDLVRPVRISAGAIADGVPSRDLYLSPDHSLFIEGVLIPVKHLINGRSIAQTAAATVEYWHVELDSHDVLLAENLPCETYLDTGNRHDFAAGGPAIALHPDFAARSWNDACAELVQDGSRLVAVKERLFHRAGLRSGRPARALMVMAAQRLLPAARLQPGVWRFAVPAATHALRLVSPAWIPAGHQAASLDRRKLGIRLLQIAIDGEAISLESPCLRSGFHAIETTAEGPCRWTDGDARMVLPAGATALTLHVADDVDVGPSRRAGGERKMLLG